MDSCLFDDDRLVVPSSFSSLSISDNDTAATPNVTGVYGQNHTSHTHAHGHTQAQLLQARNKAESHAAVPSTADPASFLFDIVDNSSTSSASSSSAASKLAPATDSNDTNALWHSQEMSGIFTNGGHIPQEDGSISIALIPDSESLRLDSSSYGLSDETSLDSHSAASAAALAISSVAANIVSGSASATAMAPEVVGTEDNSKDSVLGKLRANEEDGMMKLEEDEEKSKSGYSSLDHHHHQHHPQQYHQHQHRRHHSGFAAPVRRRWNTDSHLEMSHSNDYDYDENADNLSSASSTDSRADTDDSEDGLGFGLEDVNSDDGSQSISSTNSHSPMSSPQLSPLTDDDFSSETLAPINSSALLQPLFKAAAAAKPTPSSLATRQVSAPATNPVASSAPTTIPSSSPSILSVTRSMVTRVLMQYGKRWLSHSAIAAAAAQLFPDQYQQFAAGTHPVFCSVATAAGAASISAEERWSSLLSYPLTIASAMDEGLKSEGMALEKQRRRKEDGVPTAEKKRRKKKGSVAQEEEDKDLDKKLEKKEDEKPKKRVTFHVYRVVPISEVRKAPLSSRKRSRQSFDETRPSPINATYSELVGRSASAVLVCQSPDPSDGDLIRASLRCLLLSHSPQWLSSSHLTDLLKSSPMSDHRLHSSFLSFFQRKRSMGVTEEKANKEWKDRVMRLLKSMVKGWTEEGWRLETQRTNGGVGLSYRIMRAAEKMDEDVMQVGAAVAAAVVKHNEANDGASGNAKRRKVSADMVQDAEKSATNSRPAQAATPAPTPAPVAAPASTSAPVAPTQAAEPEEGDAMKDDNMEFTVEDHSNTNDLLSAPIAPTNRILSPTAHGITSPRVSGLLHSIPVLTPVLGASMSPLLTAVNAPVSLPIAVLSDHHHSLNIRRKSTILASFEKSDLLSSPKHLGLNAELSMPMSLSMPIFHGQI